MFKYLFSFLIFLSTCSTQVSSPEYVGLMDEDFLIFDASHGFEVFYDSGATKMVGEYYRSGSIVLNGSYFGLTDSGIYYPAGYWEADKKIGVIPGIGKQFMPVYDDPNITHFVGVSGSGVRIFENNKFKENAGPYDVAFQAGPLVLSGGFLQNFGDSWHANGPHERTLLGKTQNGKVYFFIFKKPVTLTEAGNRIIEESRFIHDPITLLNLDGGPSTAYYDGHIGFRSDKKLPIIFRINSQ